MGPTPKSVTKRRRTSVDEGSTSVEVASNMKENDGPVTRAVAKKEDPASAVVAAVSSILLVVYRPRGSQAESYEGRWSEVQR